MADLARSAAPDGSPPAWLVPYAHLVERLSSGEAVDDTASRLVDAAVEVWARPGFDTFVSIGHLHFEPFDYQLQTAETVLRRMRGRAILADEVGLGKTIEAGLVLSELRLRGLARTVLVVCPSGLVAQWREELERKFGLATRVVGSDRPGSAALPPDPPAVASNPPVAIVSLALARRSPTRDRLVGQDWDLVVVDEAHRVKNPSTASSRLVRDLRSRHLLLLTATPVENRLADLFHLASLVAPGVLGTAKQFRARHGADGTAAPRELSALRDRVGEVMVRHRRSQVALMLPRRLAETIAVAPAGAEAELYAAVAERVRAEGRDAPPARAMALRSALRLAGSSPAAVSSVAGKLGWHDLTERLPALLSSPRLPAKSEALLRVLERLGASGPGSRSATGGAGGGAGGGGAGGAAAAAPGATAEGAPGATAQKVLVFVAFRRTQDHLAGVLAGAGVPHALYHGTLTRREKEAAIEAFRADVPVLVSTEAGGEGRNLQFCHQMVNFDLPWNPMEIEQRLGRLHRIGQEHDVTVVNLVARGTVEERVLSVLETKINLFELVVGELDMILGRIEAAYALAGVWCAAHVQSRDMDELGARLEEVGERLAAARLEHRRSRERNDTLVAGGAEAEARAGAEGGAEAEARAGGDARRAVNRP
jgi:SNF2 family DNA or RNA helicase